MRSKRRRARQRAERDDRNELELGAADAARLVHAEQVRVVQIAQRLVRHAAQLLAARSALAQHGQQLLGAAPELSVVRRLSLYQSRICSPVHISTPGWACICS
jgi:hypothetical protein